MIDNNRHHHHNEPQHHLDINHNLVMETKTFLIKQIAQCTHSKNPHLINETLMLPNAQTGGAP